MDISEFLKSRKKEAHQAALISHLEKVYKDSTLGGVKNRLSGKPSISKKSAELGLLLLDALPGTKKNRPYYYSNAVRQGSKRYHRIRELITTDTPVDGEHKGVFSFLLGKALLPLAQTAWQMIPGLMYQTGYQRRSFRGPNLKEINFTNQINFLIHLIDALTYDLSLEEYILCSNQIYFRNSSLAYIIAAAIDRDDRKIIDLLDDIVLGRHDTGTVSHPVIKAMLLSGRRESWRSVEKLLLSAQRQEGLRQTILECLDETSLGAMKHMIKVIIAHKLSRFSSVVRAVDVWAGFGWESEREPTVRRFLELGDRFLNDRSAIAGGVLSRDNGEVYMALWAQGVHDVEGCYELIDAVIAGGQEEKIVLALNFVSEVRVSGFSIKYGFQFADHSNLLISKLAMGLLDKPSCIETLAPDTRQRLFDLIAGRIHEFPKKAKVYDSFCFSWLKFTVASEDVYSLMTNLIDFKDESQVEKILGYFKDLPVAQREQVTRSILPDHYGYRYQTDTCGKALTERQKAFALSIISDRAELVRESGLRAMEYARIRPGELRVFEDLLKRKAAGLRKQVIRLILKQDPDCVKASICRLLVSTAIDQRLAGLDMLSQFKHQTGAETAPWIDEQAAGFSRRKKISPKEEVLLKALLEKERGTLRYSRGNGFGLYDVTRFTPAQKPAPPTGGAYVEFISDRTLGLAHFIKNTPKRLEALKTIYLEHGDHEYEFQGWDNTRSTTLLGNNFYPFNQDTDRMSDQEKFNNYPLAHVWKSWFETSGITPCQLCLLNAFKEIDRDEDPKNDLNHLRKKFLKTMALPAIPQMGEYDWQNPLFQIIENLTLIFPYGEKREFFQGLCLAMMDKVSTNEIDTVHEAEETWTTRHFTWRDIDLLATAYMEYRRLSPKMDDESFRRFWACAQWYHNTVPADYADRERYLPAVYNYARAHALGLIEPDELIWRIMTPDALGMLTAPGKKGPALSLFKAFDFLEGLVERCRERILEIELKRGDSSTPVSFLAQELQRISGIEHFKNILVGMGQDTLHRGYIYSYGSEKNKKQIFSALLKRCHPENGETQDAFNHAVRKAQIPEKRVVEAAMYAPQWLSYATAYLGWKKFRSAVWWLHAHTNGTHDAVTESEISRYSKIEIPDFKDGAVDTDWFRDNYKALKKNRWKVLYDAAKYVSDGTGHNRAKLYADVILGQTKITQVKKRVAEKRNQDYLRVYGLVPLSKKNPQKDLLARYQYLQKFKKESRQFGSQKQASEALALRIAMENLARTAGYPDPIRLTWAMETQEAKTILADAAPFRSGPVEICLDIDDNGRSSIVCTKAGKPLKSIPAKFRKEKQVVQLKAYNKILRDQYRRTCKSLEDAMVNGDPFSTDEITALMDHPVVAPMLKKLVLISDGTLGFWRDGRLIDPKGGKTAIGDRVHIAHCSQLNENGEWEAYQACCFEHSIQQPFKQIFRELYLITEDEMKESCVSRRYAGHQVQPKKAVALLKSRGWRVDYEEGLQKVFHRHGFIAKMYAMADWFSPADVESPTLETIEFLDRKTHKRIEFSKIAPRDFSEVMRDIDLVVSVAHVGEVDPEASQSSIALRRAVIRETLRLFKINNTRIEGRHAYIKGERHEYAVHLGSGIAHKVPGVALSILPVHSQHRGRIFLPFIDDDPKTAEIISKILLLAKDREIKDPTILRQLG